MSSFWRSASKGGEESYKWSLESSPLSLLGAHSEVEILLGSVNEFRDRTDELPESGETTSRMDGVSHVNAGLLDCFCKLK